MEKSKYIDKPFSSDPNELPRHRKNEIIFAYQYGGESVEYLALKYRLIPSSIKTWLDRQGIKPVDLAEQPGQCAVLEDKITGEQKTQNLLLLGKSIQQSLEIWDCLFEVETLLSEKLITALGEAAATDVKGLAELTKIHSALFKMQVQKLSLFNNKPDSVEAIADSIEEALNGLK